MTPKEYQNHVDEQLAKIDLSCETMLYQETEELRFIEVRYFTEFVRRLAVFFSDHRLDMVRELVQIEGRSKRLRKIPEMKERVERSIEDTKMFLEQSVERERQVILRFIAQHAPADINTTDLITHIKSL